MVLHPANEEESANPTCRGTTWEKLTCHNPTTCFDSKFTCSHWDVADCCSPTPLYKCLLPTAAAYFAPECSSPIDGRQQCCGDATTHERTTDVEEAIKAASGEVEEAIQAAVVAGSAEAKELLDATKEFLEVNDTGVHATCTGATGTWEKLTCHNPSTCFDATVTCKHWDVADCCSPTPLYKCLLPTATSYFAAECSFPIDGRQQCCGDAITHERTTDLEEAIKAASGEVEEAIQAAVAAGSAEAQTLLAETKAFMEENHDPCADKNMVIHPEKCKRK